ncbi:PREDICTED: uncharacterized protein LOC106726943 [Myotis brandtii]|uniref:uncharacterized protein LOC106726943 n=1 Tax=Myotis brandtii TaxID=109478 RepID=UPI000703FA25|nr:PREDICTED: uncharacterized protein LOC106726943 [Myotis brandtii]
MPCAGSLVLLSLGDPPTHTHTTRGDCLVVSAQTGGGLGTGRWGACHWGRRSRVQAPQGGGDLVPDVPARPGRGVELRPWCRLLIQPGPSQDSAPLGPGLGPDEARAPLSAPTQNCVKECQKPHENSFQHTHTHTRTSHNLTRREVPGGATCALPSCPSPSVCPSVCPSVRPSMCCLRFCLLLFCCLFSLMGWRTHLSARKEERAFLLGACLLAGMFIGRGCLQVPVAAAPPPQAAPPTGLLLGVHRFLHFPRPCLTLVPGSCLSCSEPALRTDGRTRGQKGAAPSLAPWSRDLQIRGYFWKTGWEFNF